MILILIPFFLCWGSFLNMVAHRIIRSQSIVIPRSYCPSCRRTLLWYDLIPVFSWLFLRGCCRFCRCPISPLYLFIELLTTAVMLLMIHRVAWFYMPAYFVFFSALIITIRSDIEMMLISRQVTIFLAPLGFFYSLLGLLPISPLESVGGFLFGYTILWIVRTLSRFFLSKDGIGQGDLDLLAFIGSFLGSAGCWFSLLIGSVLGSIIGLCYALREHKLKNVKIPFGPFLATGAIIFTMWGDKIVGLFFSPLLQ